MSVKHEYVTYDQKGKPLTVDYRGMIPTRAPRLTNLGDLLLTEAIQCLLQGDLETGKNALKHCIKAKMGFADLARQTGQTTETLTLMLTPGANPKMQDLLQVINHLRQQSNLHLTVEATPQENPQPNAHRRRGRYTRNHPRFAPSRNKRYLKEYAQSSGI